MAGLPRECCQGVLPEGSTTPAERVTAGGCTQCARISDMYSLSSAVLVQSQLATDTVDDGVVPQHASVLFSTLPCRLLSVSCWHVSWSTELLQARQTTAVAPNM
jgi:hypothetical protein